MAAAASGVEEEPQRSVELRYEFVAGRSVATHRVRDRQRDYERRGCIAGAGRQPLPCR